MICKAKEEDVKAIFDMYSNEMNQGHDFEPVKYTISDFYEYCNDDRAILLVYKENNAVMGFVMAYDLISWCYLDIICVGKKFRGKGISIKLVDEIFKIKPRFEAIEACYYNDDLVMDNYFKKRGFELNHKKITWVSKEKK